MENTLKKRYTVPFVQTPRDVVNSCDLSWKAKGLLTYLLDKPDDWNFSIAGIASQGKDKTDSVASGLKELTNHGYLRITKTRCPVSKKFIGVLWEITPFSNNFSETGFSSPGFSSPGKTPTSNNQGKKDSLEEKNKQKDATTADASALCDFLLAKIKEKKPNTIAKVTPSWRKEAEKLLKVRMLPELQRVIEFIIADDFMSQWAFSMAKITKHLDAAETKMATMGTIKGIPPYARENKKHAQELEQKHPLRSLPKPQSIEAREEWLEIKVSSDRPNPEVIEYKDVEFKKKVEICLKTMGLNG